MGFFRSRIFFWGIVGGVLACCASVQSEEGTSSEVSPAFSPSVAVSTAPSTPPYVYRGDRFRDPFIPLVGALSGGFDGPRLSLEPLGPFNPVGAELKGILKTTTGRWAVIRTVEGVTYLIQNGKIFDPKRKAVDGFQGIVKEKTVVILGPKNQEVEVRLKKDADAAKAPH
jgi:hypothetical protein